MEGEGQSDDDSSDGFEYAHLSQALLSLGDKLHYQKALADAQDDMKELRERVQTAQRKLSEQQYENYEESWQELVQILKDLQSVWEVTPRRFVMNVTVLGYQAKEYLDFLSICLDSSKFWKRLHFDLHSHVGECSRAVVLTHTLSEFEISSPSNLEWCRAGFSYMDHITSASRDYVTHWTSLQALVAPNDIGDMIWIAKALYNCGDYSDCYNSVAARTILDQYWADVFGGYVLRLALDFSFLLSLGCNTAWIMYTPAHEPWYWMTRVSGVLAVRAALSPVFDLSATCYHYGWKMGLVEIASFWQLLWAATEFYVGITLTIPLMNTDANVMCDMSMASEQKMKHSCVFIKHPNIVMAAIGMTWFHLILDLMCVKFFGMNVLPAVAAMTGSQFAKFALFIFLVLVASLQAYWSLPIPANQPREGYSALSNTLEKIFRLDILGDYDEGDLEGVSPVIQRNATSWEIVPGQESGTYHDGIRILSFFLATVVAIGVINMSIGVLSHAYDENKAKANQIYYHFRSVQIFRLSLRRKYLCFFCPRRNTENNENTYNQLKGNIVRFHEETFWDAEDLAIHVKQIQERLDRLQKNTEEKERKLEHLLVNMCEQLRKVKNH